MQKLLLAVLATGIFSCSSWLQAEQSNGFMLGAKEKSYAKKNSLFLAKKPVFPEITQKGHLVLRFITRRIATGIGTWQAFVITPDKRKFHGPEINVTTSSQIVKIVIDPPILSGPYTLVFLNKNISNRPNLDVNDLIITEGSNGQQPQVELIFDDRKANKYFCKRVAVLHPQNIRIPTPGNYAEDQFLPLCH